MTLKNKYLPTCKELMDILILHGKKLFGIITGTFPDVAIYTVWLLFHVSSRFLEVKYSKYGSLNCEGAGIT